MTIQPDHAKRSCRQGKAECGRRLWLRKTVLSQRGWILQALSDGAEIHVAWTDGSTLASKVMPAEVAGYDLAKSVLGWISNCMLR
jgi:hypothetical protein